MGRQKGIIYKDGFKFIKNPIYKEQFLWNEEQEKKRQKELEEREAREKGQKLWWDRVTKDPTSVWYKGES